MHSKYNMNTLQQRALKRYQRASKGLGLNNVKHLHNIRELIHAETLSAEQQHMLEQFCNSTAEDIRTTVYWPNSAVRIHSRTETIQLKRTKIS